MYDSKTDIDHISLLMKDIQEGKMSRNKNFYTLAKSKEYNRFKRAKLLLSLVEDILRTTDMHGSEVKVERNSDRIEVHLYNPTLKYNRTVVISELELTLLSDYTDKLLV